MTRQYLDIARNYARDEIELWNSIIRMCSESAASLGPLLSGFTPELSSDELARWADDLRFAFSKGRYPDAAGLLFS